MILPQLQPAPWQSRPFFSHHLHSLRQLERVNESGGIAVAFRPPGRIVPQVRIAGGQSTSLCLWHTLSASGFVTIPKIETDVLTVRFVRRGQMVRQGAGDAPVGRPGYATLTAFNDMRRAEASPDFDALSVTITRGTLAAGHDALEGRDDGLVPDFQPVAATDNPPMRALQQILHAILAKLHDGQDRTDLFFPIMEEVITFQLLATWPRTVTSDRPPTAPPASARIRPALDYIDGHLSRPITLAEIAAAAGVSVRSLQIGFRKEIGLSPIAFLIERRLQRAHADLCGPADPSVSVGDIARRWGFVHMSDFSRRYRERFGCTPRQTRQAQTGGDR